MFEKYGELEKCRLIRDFGENLTLYSLHLEYKQHINCIAEKFLKISYSYWFLKRICLCGI